MSEVNLIKRKVDEAAQEAWDLIAKKAFEAGVKDGTRSLWLFFSRVNAHHFAILNEPRLMASQYFYTPQAEEELK